MAKSLSNDLRKRVVEAVENGLSRRAAADKFNVGISSAIRWVDRYRKTGSWDALKRGQDKGQSPLEVYKSQILALVESKKDITLNEIVEYLYETYGLQTSKSSVDRFFTRHNISFKKRQRMPVSKTDQM